MHSKRLMAAGLALLAGTAYAEQLGRGWWHGRYVNYTVRNGIARYQGDIVLGPVSRIPREPPPGEPAKSNGFRNATFLTGLKQRLPLARRSGAVNSRFVVDAGHVDRDPIGCRSLP